MEVVGVLRKLTEDAREHRRQGHIRTWKIETGCGWLKRGCVEGTHVGILPLVASQGRVWLPKDEPLAAARGYCTHREKSPRTWCSWCNVTELPEEWILRAPRERAPDTRSPDARTET
jgi:hypothetical protein